MTGRMRGIMILALALTLAACGGLPKQMRVKAKNFPAAIDSAAAEIEAARKQYAAFAKSSEFAFFAPYAEREKWLASFDAAERSLQQARDLNARVIQPVLKENKAEREAEMSRGLAHASQALRTARDAAREPMRRRTFIAEARENAPGLIAEARRQAPTLDTLVANLRPVVAQAKANYPRRAVDVDTLFERVASVEARADSALRAAEREFAAHEAGKVADYAVLGDGAALVGTSLTALQKNVPALRSKLAELDRSYTKILADMRVDYWIEVGRTSWDDYSDFPTEHEHVYPAKQVDEATFEAVVSGANQSGGVLATYSKGFGSRLSTRIPDAVWAKLGIDPEVSWHSGDDDAEFWIDEAEPRTYHKYLVVENGDTTTTDWQEVDEEDFWDMEDDLGMEIASKPYGYFESEVIEEPAPPGMAYVGNAKYGEWKKDASGNSFWHWYGQYAFFSMLMGGPNYRYSYNDWSDWDRNYRGRRGYYGRDEKNPTYGTWGGSTASSGRFSRTTFAQQGGFRSQDASVRGAGPSSRGRGPGGGGK